MRRRQFLGLLAALAAGAAGSSTTHRAIAQAERNRWWSPQPFALDAPVVLEWRYLAGRLIVGGEPIGFVLSVASFNGTYSLSVSSPELSLSDLALRPQTPFVAEDNAGSLTVARFGSALVNSDYHNDWVAVEQSGEVIGYARLDLQTLRPTGIATPTGFQHHWFAVAGQAGADQIWLSAYELVSEATYWYMTLGRLRPGGDWSVEQFSGSSPGVAYPLRVSILDWQPHPDRDGAVSTPARRAGKRWRISAGRAAPGDILNLDLEVLPGQFLQGARISGVITGEAMQEAVGTTARGLVGGAPLGNLRFILAESTYSEPGEPPPARQRLSLPLLRR